MRLTYCESLEMNPENIHGQFTFLPYFLKTDNSFRIGSIEVMYVSQQLSLFTGSLYTRTTKTLINVI